MLISMCSISNRSSLSRIKNQSVRMQAPIPNRVPRLRTQRLYLYLIAMVLRSLLFLHKAIMVFIVYFLKTVFKQKFEIPSNYIQIYLITSKTYWWLQNTTKTLLKIFRDLLGLCKQRSLQIPHISFQRVLTRFNIRYFLFLFLPKKIILKIIITAK